MTLTKHRLGELIELVDERNDLGIRRFYGLNKAKEFMPTAASTDSLDERKYKIVRKGRFAFSGMQTGRDEVIRVSLYQQEEPIIVSPAYATFEVVKTDVILPEYLFMVFRSPEMDRYGWFVSDSSVRSNLDWDVFCDIEIQLPPLDVQRKYAKIYQVMKENLQAYEDKLEELQVAYELQLDSVKQLPRRPLGELIGEVDVRNRDLTVTSASGVNKQKVFMPSKAAAADLSNYKLVRGDQLACNLMHIGRDEVIPVSMNRTSRPVLVSPAYLVMSVNADVDPGYLFAWLCRSEVDRQAWFVADTSIRSGLEKARFYELEIPLPSKEMQRGIAELQAAYEQRRSFCERLQDMIKDICPVLVRGALLEGERMEVSS